MILHLKDQCPLLNYPLIAQFTWREAWCDFTLLLCNIASNLHGTCIGLFLKQFQALVSLGCSTGFWTAFWLEPDFYFLHPVQFFAHCQCHRHWNICDTGSLMLWRSYFSSVKGGYYNVHARTDGYLDVKCCLYSKAGPTDNQGPLLIRPKPFCPGLLFFFFRKLSLLTFCCKIVGC